MKNIILGLAALAAVAGLKAQSSAYSVTADFSYSSRYVFRGIQLTDEALQPSVEVNAGNAYVGVWTSQPVTKNQDNEIDFYGGYKFPVDQNLSFEVVGTYYYYPEARNGEVHESYEAGVGATYNVPGIAYGTVSTSVYAYYDFRLEAQTYQASVGYSLPLRQLSTSLDLTLNWGTVTADNWNAMDISENYNYFGADISLPYHLSEKASVVAAAHYAGNKNIMNVPDDKVWYSVGVSVGF